MQLILILLIALMMEARILMQTSIVCLKFLRW